MSSFASLARRCATGFVAAQMMLGATSVTTLALAAPAQASVLEPHGAWRGFTTTINGRRVFGVSNPTTAGRVTAVLDEDGILNLVIMDPNWHLDPGVCVSVNLTVDGQTYGATGTLLGNDMIEMKNVSRGMLSAFTDGAEAKVDVANGTIVWTLDLHGFTDSMTEAARLYQASA